MRGHASGSSEFDDEAPLVSHGRGLEHPQFDITAMIDLVFMLNIFFLVTTVAAAMAELDLPVVRHCIPTDGDTAVVVNMLRGAGDETTVMLGEHADGEPLTNVEEQIRRVREYVEEGQRSGKRILLLKAERSVKLRDVQRLGAIAREIPGTELRLAVIEKE